MKTFSRLNFSNFKRDDFDTSRILWQALSGGATYDETLSFDFDPLIQRLNVRNNFGHLDFFVKKTSNLRVFFYMYLGSQNLSMSKISEFQLEFLKKEKSGYALSNHVTYLYNKKC